MIYFTSDTHFHHKAILEYCNRKFSSIEEMNETLISNWNKVVKPGDSVYHLGDFSWGNFSKVKSVFDRLNGSKHLIRGNHDDIRMHKKLAWNFIDKDYELKAYDKLYMLYHFPQRSWDKSIHGARHLFGHCHGSAKPWGFSFDVGCDCWDYTPVSIETIEETIAKLPRFNPEYNNSIMPPGKMWNGKEYNYSFNDFFVGDGSLDNVPPEILQEPE